MFPRLNSSLRGIVSSRYVDGKRAARPGLAVTLFLIAIFGCGPRLLAATGRSTYIPYDSNWIGGPDSKWIAVDTAHQQVFTAWMFLDRVDILSTTDYHLIHSIPVPSPTTLDISPDGTTLAIGTEGSHVLFFDTGTYVKTNDIIFPGAALGITAFLYSANGNAIIRAQEGLSTGGGVTTYWNHATNSFTNTSDALHGPTTALYSTNGPLARSGDYSKFILGDASSGGSVQIIDGNTGQLVWSTGQPETPGFGGYILGVAANKDGSRYAVCVEPAGVSPSLLILDSSFDEVYQDQVSCGSDFVFSPDGQTLYRNYAVGSTPYVQALDMTSFTGRNIPNYDAVSYWEGADATGMIYGVSPNIAQGTMAWVALDTTSTSALQIPPVDDPVAIVHVIDNIGSPQGGDTIRLLCAGVDKDSASSISAAIGGQPATVVAVNQADPFSLPNLRIVTVKTPPGTSGFADVVLSANGSSFTATKGFQYANSRTIFPFSTSPTYLLYDSLRNRLYASHGDQVEVIDAAGQKLLSPLVPIGGKLANSQFAGLSLSPDQDRLYISDAGAGMIHELDLTKPGSGYSMDVGKAIGYPGTVSPWRVFELSNGKLLGSNNGVFVIDPATQTGSWAMDPSGNQIIGLVWNTTNRGENALVTNDCGGVDWACVGIWNANASSHSEPSIETGVYPEAAVNEDGTVIALGNSGVPGIDSFPEIADFRSYPEGDIVEHFDVAMPAGTPGMLLHPSGALLYQVGSSYVSGANLPAGTVEIDDLHQWQPAASIVLPEPVTTMSPANYTYYSGHLATIDGTGRTFFAVTQSGITMMVLNTIPISIGNIQPAFVLPQAGQSVTVRGSGFQSGATVSIGGTQAATNFVDENTLTVQTPALTSGWSDVTVTLPGGSSYTAAGILQVIGTDAVPAITAFSPSSIVIQGTTDTSQHDDIITIMGSGFGVFDTVEINGQLVASAFIDAGHIQATVPASFLGQAGSLSLAVISPYGGASNVLALPMVNPVPVLESNPPLTVIPGQAINLNLKGTGFVQGSTIQWNGQNLATSLYANEVSASIPAGLTAQAGVAAVTVLNPGPGGGISNAISVDIAAAQPEITVALFDNNNNLVREYYTFPASIDFGNLVVNTSTMLVLQLQNVGTGAYTVNSSTITSGSISLQTSPCVGIAPSTINCTVPLTFAPTATGPVAQTLTISDNAPGSPHAITLTGTGVETPVPAVTLSNISSLMDTISAAAYGKAVLGGPTIPGTAWMEYGTDPTLSTFTQSPTWNLNGDGLLSGNLTGLIPNTQYAVRFAVQTSGGTGKSAIHLFATAPAWPQVYLAMASGKSNTATVSAGQTATYSLMVFDQNGYTGTANLTCTLAPVGATCAVSPSQVAVSTTAVPITVTVTTTGSTSAKAAPASKRFNLALCVLLGSGIFAFRRKLNKSSLLLCVVAAIMVASITSCGGGGSGTGGGGIGGGGGTATPPGTYSLEVNASSGGAQTSQSLTLTVK